MSAKRGERDQFRSKNAPSSFVAGSLLEAEGNKFLTKKFCGKVNGFLLGTFKSDRVSLDQRSPFLLEPCAVEMVFLNRNAVIVSIQLLYIFHKFKNVFLSAFFLP